MQPLKKLNWHVYCVLYFTTFKYIFHSFQFNTKSFHLPEETLQNNTKECMFFLWILFSTPPQFPRAPPTISSCNPNFENSVLFSGPSFTKIRFSERDLWNIISRMFEMHFESCDFDKQLVIVGVQEVGSSSLFLIYFPFEFKLNVLLFYPLPLGPFPFTD